MRCTAALASAAPLTIELSAPGAPTRSFTSGAVATTHELLAWGLLPQTTYTYSGAGEVGEITTGALPDALRAATIHTNGTAWGFDAVLHPLDCGADAYFVMIDGQGRIVWYEPNDVLYPLGMNGYEWSQESLSVLSVDRAIFLEQHVSGEILLELERSVDFDQSLHHDADRWGDYRYLLFEYPRDGIDVDGIYVFDGDVLIGTFLLGDHFVVSGVGQDWSHANGLNVTEDGEIILSLRELDTIVSIDGDPASPTFLQINWHAVGSAAGLPDPDYLPADGPDQGFSGQHNASRHGDALWIFDNVGDGTRSRAIRARMDHAGGTLDVEAQWWFDARCDNQGGAIPIEGGVLATCANRGEVWAFHDEQASPGWTLEADCGQGGGGALDMTRGIPVWIGSP